MSKQTTDPSTIDPLITDVERFITRYVSLAADELRVIAVWILHTWQFSEQCPTPNTTPYLYIFSAQKGSGKTLLGIDVLETLVRNPLQTLNMTGPTVFRIVEDMRPTLLIDEVDAIWSGAKNDELRGVLNAGYRRGGKVPRVVPGGEVRMFSVFGPKALVGIDNAMLPDTVRDRCIPIHMHRATDSERADIQPFYHYEIEDEVAVVADRLHSWAVVHGAAIRDYRPTPIDGLSPRQWEICQSLLAVAHAAGCEASVREALARIFGNAVERRSPEQDLLSMIFEVFNDVPEKLGGPRDRVTTNEILAHIASDPRFASYNGQRLGKVLAPFGVTPTTIRMGNIVAKGYMRAAFIDAWERYL